MNLRRGALALLVFSCAGYVDGQTWTALNNPPPTGLSHCLLLTNGSVICQSSASLNNFYKLTPDIHGSYLNGTWSQIASLPAGYFPMAYGSAVLADGRVVIEGGEYDGGGNFVLSNRGAIYDPKTNTWTEISPPAGWSYIGDAPTAVLPNGQLLLGSKLNQQLALLDPTTLTWTLINPTGKIDGINSEEDWTILPDGSVFTLDVKNAPNSERYLPSTQTWVSAGVTPVGLASGPDEGPIQVAPGVVYVPPGEVGPALRLPNGTLFVEGGNGKNAIFTPPPPSSTAPGTWVSAPSFPSGLAVDDGPSAILPNGHVLAPVSPPSSNKGLAIFEFDGTNLIPEPNIPNAASDASNYVSLLLLPTGQAMLVDTSNIVEIYTPTGAYDPSWAPNVSSVPPVLTSGSTYQVQGTQFNGLSQGTGSGDELENATNYPLVRITNTASGHVFYAYTHNHSTMGIATGATPVSTSFDVAANTELGASTLVVVANGIPSTPVSVTITNAVAPALTLTCPASTAQVAVPYSSNAAAIGGQPPFTYSIATGNLPSGFLLDQNTGAITGTPGAAGSATFSIQATDSFQTPDSVTTSCTITTSAGPTVGFQGFDLTTQGTWKGVYGKDGWIIANDSTSPPAYAVVVPSGAASWSWSPSTTDPRALQQGAFPSNRIASTFYSSTGFSFDINLTDGQTHQVALYSLDYDAEARTQTVTVMDASSHAVLDTRAMSFMQGGVYAVWNLQGHVVIQVIRTGGLNAVVSGLFFGTPVSAVPLPLVNITSPSAGAVSGSVTLTANATSGVGIASVQFQLDGTNLGTPLTGPGPDYSTPWSSVTATNGPHTLTAIATDTLSRHTTSAGVAVTVSNAGGGSPGTAFLTGYGLSGKSARIDFNGWVGMKLTVGANPLTVSALGRICVANNVQTHVVKFVKVSDGSDLAGASASVNMAGCTPNQFTYGTIAPVTLAAGTSYYLVSQETPGADQWYDQSGVSATNVAVVNSSVYSYNGVWYPIGAANTSYVPPNFQYSVVIPTPITVNVAASPTGPSFSVDGTTYNSAQVLTWSSGASHTIATTSPQSAGAGTQYAWSGWSDGGAISHTVAPASGFTYTASFTTQFQLTSNVSPAGGGSIVASPSSAGGYYDSGTPVQLTATPASGCTFVNWTGGLTANPQTVTMSAPQTVTANFQCSGPPPAGFVTSYAVNSPPLRNDYPGFVGMKLTVGSSPLTVSSLGRICVANNAQTHTVKFVKASDGSDVASASVNMAGCTPGQFVYQAISPATLTAGASYYLASQETQGGDRWYDEGTITAAAGAVVNSGAYLYNGNWYTAGPANTSYVPPNFQYSTGGGGTGGSPGAPTVTVTYPTNNLTVSGIVAVTATAGASSPATVASVQFILDGGNLGSAATTAPYSVNWDTTLVPNGPHTLTATVKDSIGQTATSSPISVAVSNGTVVSPAGTPLLASYTANPSLARNDFAGWAGMYFTVTQSSTMVVSSLGRICLSGNTGTHIVKLVDSTTGQDFPAASASVSMAGCTAGQFKYVSLPNAIQLPPGSSYYLVSQEVTGGDTWYDAAAVTAAGASVNSSLYSWNGTWVRSNDGAKSFVPPNLKFGAAGAANAAPTVSIASPVIGGTVSGATAVTANAAASAPSTVASVTFFLDGATLATVSAPAAFSFNWDTTTTSNGSHVLTAIALDSAGLTTISTPVPVTVNNGGSSGGPPFIITFATYNPTLRNNFAGFAGTQLTVPSGAPLPVTFVGRACAQSNSGAHIVKFVDVTTGLDVPGGSALVSMAGCTPGQFSWSALPSPISLTAGATYYLVSEEFIGGDLWYEKGPVTTQSFASIISAVYQQDNGLWHRIAPPNYAYVPPNFK